MNKSKLKHLLKIGMLIFVFSTVIVACKKMMTFQNLKLTQKITVTQILL